MFAISVDTRQWLRYRFKMIDFDFSHSTDFFQNVKYLGQQFLLLISSKGDKVLKHFPPLAETEN